MRKIWIAMLVVLCGFVLGPRTEAETLVSASFIVLGSNLNSGGAVLMTGPSLMTLGGSIGQAEAIGLSGSTSSLSTAAPGFWPIVAGDFPNLDSDLDGLQAFRDNCPFANNPLQEDIGGVGVASLPDGIGNACQCGDTNDNGLVDPNDRVVLEDAFVDPINFPLTPAGQSKCDVIDADDPCSLPDLVVIRRNVDGTPLLPGISQTCEATRP